MKRINGFTFLETIEKQILVLDGASGTTLQKQGMNGCPEKWAAEHPEAVIEMQKDYIKSGSNAVYSFTFGGNPVKLKEYGIEDVYGINKMLAQISVRAAEDKAFVGGDVSSTGLFLEPMGELSFDKAVEIFKEQIRGLYDGGVDFIIIETMIDIAEARAALIAAKETCPLPVAVSLSFDENGRTLTGTAPGEAAAALIAAGADIVGVNCSTGPDKMVRVAAEIKKVSTKPVLVKPNAGLPQIVDGQTVFSLQPEDFAKYVIPFIEAGANLIGGCCGTNKDFIKAIVKEAQGHKPLAPLQKSLRLVSCANQSVTFDKPVVVGRGLDATANPAFVTLLEQKDYEGAFDIALDERDFGADVLQISIPKEYDTEVLNAVAEIAAARLKFPLILKSDHPRSVESFLRRYTGRAVIHTVGKEGFAAVCASAKKYGAAVMLCCANMLEAYEKALHAGLEDEDVIFHITAEGKAAVLEAARWCAQKKVPFAYSLNSIVDLDLADALKKEGLNFALAFLQDEKKRNLAGYYKM